MDFSVNDNTSISTGLTGSDSSGLNPAISDDYGLSLNTQQPNLLYYGSDNDVITALGNDAVTVFAGEGNNLINTGSGSDVIYAGSGRDYIYAGDGNNIIFAGEGVNNILTGNGNDLIYGGASNDTIYTGAGNDTIYAGEGNNIINAGTGNDTLFIGSGKDRIILEAGEGAVTIFGFDVNNDKLRLGESLLDESLEFVSEGVDTLVKAGNDLLATLKGVTNASETLIDNGTLYRYQVTDLGSLSTNPNGAVTATTINDFGVIAGRYETGATFQLEGATQPIRQGFVWENGSQTPLTSTGVKNGESALGASNGAAVTLLNPNIRTISNSGRIIGSGDEGQNAENPQDLDIDRALLWKSANDFTIYDFGQLESYFFDTNSQNQNAGRQIFSTQYIEPIYWDNGVLIGLPTLGSNGGTAQGLNNQGQLVGAVDTDGIVNSNRQAVNTAALWEKDSNGIYQFQNLGTFGAQQASARDINNVGSIIGTATNGTGTTATSTPFVLRDGEFTALGSLGGKTGSVNGINDFGQVVGASQIDLGTNHAYVWNNGVISDLNDLITTPLTYNGANVTLNSAVSVNNFGEIVATGTYTYKDAAGLTQTGTRSYLLKATV